jgi:hypothetical protein
MHWEGKKLIPIELWQSNEMTKRRENAEAKARREKPKVVLDAPGFSTNFYRVADKYTVQTYEDPDGQTFIECGCLAGSPPIDENTGLPSREAVCCYHAASVLIFIAEQGA